MVLTFWLIKWDNSVPSSFFGRAGDQYFELNQFAPRLMQNICGLSEKSVAHQHREKPPFMLPIFTVKKMAPQKSPPEAASVKLRNVIVAIHLNIVKIEDVPSRYDISFCSIQNAL